MDLSELARLTKDRDEMRFAADHRDPALVFVTAFASDEKPRVDTPPGGTKLGSTNTLKSTDAFPVAELCLMAPDANGRAATPDPIGTSLVIFLAKTGKNPFGSMITVGRAGNNDVCLRNASISKVHAYFSCVGSTWKVTDQRATNGTFVDGVRLQPGAASMLTDGTRIGFGPEVRARFYTPQGLYGFLQLFRAGIAV